MPATVRLFSAFRPVQIYNHILIEYLLDVRTTGIMDFEAYQRQYRTGLFLVEDKDDYPW